MGLLPHVLHPKRYVTTRNGAGIEVEGEVLQLEVDGGDIARNLRAQFLCRIDFQTPPSLTNESRSG